MKELEKELLKNGWKQVRFDDKSGYWFTKNYQFPVFDTIEVTMDSDSGQLTFNIEGEVTGDYADMTFKGINSYDAVDKLIKEKLGLE